MMPTYQELCPLRIPVEEGENVHVVIDAGGEY